MRKIMYSAYTKFIIGILAVLCVILGMKIGLDGVKKWDDYEKEVFLFESRFENSHFLANQLIDASYCMYNSAVQYAGDPAFDVKGNLEHQMKKEVLDYSLRIDENVYASMEEKEGMHTYYYKIQLSREGVLDQEIYPDRGVWYSEMPELKNHEVEIYVGLKNDYAAECEKIWTEQAQLVNGNIKSVVLWCLCALACVIFLIITVGRDWEGKKKSSIEDRIFVEGNLFIIGAAAVAAAGSVMTFLDAYINEDLPYDLFLFFMELVAGAAFALVLILFLSLVRNIKNKTFLSHSLIFIFAKCFVQGIKKIGRGMREMTASRRTGSSVLILFFYTGLIGYFGYMSFWGAFYILFGVLLFVVLGYFVARYLNSLDKIKKGVREIREGEIAYKIENLPFRDLNILKDGIQEMSEGLKASVSKVLKAERLKTELITNVSHDLKTPLTSIISYTKLLSQIEDLPEEAKDYVAVIDKKSQRLKNLTQDLFDISKVQSGNETIVLEELDVETLFSQALAEYEHELEQLTLCIKIEENLKILSDGRKMSRVISNLLVNIKKYTLAGTRAFINAYSRDHKVFIEMKNISSYPLDFDKEEIIQRFKRGDESRTEEGHGLGLAIAKSYVEATGGSFDILLDGDMFKVIIEYEKIS